jgi:predicted flap endonuclease-1-like 5' DNA nuclease
MKNKNIRNFWIGFTISAIAAAIIYWLAQSKREILPGPIIVRKDQEEPKVDVKEIAEPTTTDDLSRIRGVGPAYAQRLNEAGIYTFEQLARTSPENLRQVTKDRRWDPEEWIAEASDFSNKAIPADQVQKD